MTGSPAVAPLAVALATLVSVALLTEAVRRLALRRGIVDHPARHKPHARPTPLLGGTAIALGALLPLLLLPVIPLPMIPFPAWEPALGAILIGSVVVAATGFVDDLSSLGAAPRLAVEAVAAGAVAAAGGRIGLLDGWLDPVGSWLDALVTVVWIVVVTNSFNLLDNTDGAAAAVGAVTAAVLAIAAYLGGRDDVGLLLVALSAGCLGFLTHNWAPARVFMGDTGSLFLGFVITSSAVVVRPPAGPLASGAALLLVTFVATVDTCLVVVSRTRAGRSLLVGGTDHVAHRLRRLRLSVSRVVLVLLAAAAGSGLLGLFVMSRAVPPLPVLALTLTAGAAAVWLLLKVPAQPAPERIPPGGSAVPSGQCL